MSTHREPEIHSVSRTFGGSVGQRETLRSGPEVRRQKRSAGGRGFCSRSPLRQTSEVAALQLELGAARRSETANGSKVKTGHSSALAGAGKASIKGFGSAVGSGNVVIKALDLISRKLAEAPDKNANSNSHVKHTIEGGR